MVKAPLIQKKDQKKTLSAQKGKKEVIKNLLSNPYDNYFPETTQFEAASLLELLQQLSFENKKQIAVPWDFLRSIPKESRKEARLKYLVKQNDNATIDSKLKGNVMFGVNEITRSLETDECPVTVLITADVNPRYMIKHVIDLCVLKKVNVLAVPKLRETLKSVTGFGTIALALKDFEKLNAINDKVKKICENYPVPSSHAHYTELHTAEMSTSEDEENENIDYLEVKDYHLIRTDCRTRVYVPESSRMVVEMDSKDFFAFKEDQSLDKASYKGVKVKMIRKNKDRPKKFKSMI